MENFRTSSLFHYTKKENIEKILRDGFIPNYCREELTTYNKTYIVGIPMVSFCDIPLMRTQEFTKRYGSYAVGLSKDWAIRNKINPVFYINHKSITQALLFYRSYELGLQKKLANQGIEGNSMNINLNLGENQKLPQVADFLNHKLSKINNFYLFGFSKMYKGYNSHEKKPQCNYEENEWRYVVNEKGDDIKWKWDKEEMDAWRGDLTSPKPEPTQSLKSCSLSFMVNDISHIVVKDENEIPCIVKSISKIDRICDHEISEDDKKLLYTRIISMEKIANDF